MCGTPLLVMEARTCRSASGRLSRAGFVDAYRLHHPEPGRYTWWDYRVSIIVWNSPLQVSSEIHPSSGYEARPVPQAR
jgi:hypothetical protein